MEVQDPSLACNPFRRVASRMSRAAPVPAFAFLLAFAACGDRSAPSADAGWFLEEEFRIVGPPEGFGVIEAIAADADDYIYVLDRTDQQVFVFDPSGAYSHAIGRSGEGPGELSRAAGVSVGPGNRIWVPDPATARVSVFERGGEFVAALARRGRGYPGTGKWDRSVGRNGRYTDWRVEFPGRMRGNLPAETQVFPFVLGNAEDGTLPPEDATAGAEPATDSFPPLEYTAEMVQVGGRAAYRNFYAGSFLYALENGRDIWFGHSREYRIYKRPEAGIRSGFQDWAEFSQPARSRAKGRGTGVDAPRFPWLPFSLRQLIETGRGTGPTTPGQPVEGGSSTDVPTPAANQKAFAGKDERPSRRRRGSQKQSGRRFSGSPMRPLQLAENTPRDMQFRRPRAARPATASRQHAGFSHTCARNARTLRDGRRPERASVRRKAASTSVQPSPGRVGHDPPAHPLRPLGAPPDVRLLRDARSRSRAPYGRPRGHFGGLSLGADRLRPASRLVGRPRGPW